MANSLSPCHGSKIGTALADGVLTGHCEYCHQPVVRLNPTTGEEEWLFERHFSQLVKHELVQARGLHPPMHSGHEGYAVILEEIRELEREVFIKNQDKAKILGELIQVAAMCQRMAEDLRLL